MKKFSLVLSGGGALGIAQVGILKQLEDNNKIPSEIIGTSIGSIIGAAYAIGYNSNEILLLLKNFSNIFNWINLKMNGNSLINSKKIEDILYKIFKDLKIKDSKIKLKIIATNLKTGVGESLDENILIKDAILASIAIPGIFQEKEINNIVYVDGFLSDNLGINFSTYHNVLAVDVLGFNSYTPDLPNNFFKTKNMFSMFEKSMRLLIFNQTRNIILNSNKNIYLVDLYTKNFKTFNFGKVNELYKIGLEHEVDFS
jgi:NTE family protein